MKKMRISNKQKTLLGEAFKLYSEHIFNRDELRFRLVSFLIQKNEMKFKHEYEKCIAIEAIIFYANSSSIDEYTEASCFLLIQDIKVR